MRISNDDDARAPVVDVAVVDRDRQDLDVGEYSTSWPSALTGSIRASLYDAVTSPS